MDEEGYMFTPTTLLLLIPIIVVAIAYSGIINELNIVSNLAIGGDVTSTTALNIYSAMEKGSADAGRNAAFSATRKVIDERKFFSNSGTNSSSKAYVKERVLYTMNDYVVQACKDLETQSGREIYLNNQSVNNQTSQLIYDSDITITQENPYGFYVNIKGGIPIRVVQKDQTYEGVTPPIKVPVSVQGLEDPYIWLNTQYLDSDLIFSYPEYREGITYQNGVKVNPYRFDVTVDTKLSSGQIQFLWYCLNGTDNPSSIGNRPYYFPDPSGLSFFDRLENRTNSNSTADPSCRMSTFIIGDPLGNAHNTSTVSKIDHEYFTYPTYNPAVYPITIKNSALFRDPLGYPFYLSQNYFDLFALNKNYN